MTCIVAIKDGRTIIMSGDSAATDENRISIQKVPKTFKLCVPGGPNVVPDNGGHNTEMLVGFAGCFRGAQLMKHSLKVPAWTMGSHEDYLVRHFLPEVIKVFQAHGLGTKEDPLGLLLLLVGLDGRLFEIEGNGQVLENMSGYASIGTGAEVALASMCTLLDNTDDTHE